MRALCGLIVVCLVAATGAQPLRAAATEHDAARARLAERHPALPAASAARHAAPLVASRPSGVDPRQLLGVLPAPPVPAVVAASAADDADRRCDHPGSISISIRSARGPPAR